MLWAGRLRFCHDLAVRHHSEGSASYCRALAKLRYLAKSESVESLNALALHHLLELLNVWVLAVAQYLLVQGSSAKQLGRGLNRWFTVDSKALVY